MKRTDTEKAHVLARRAAHFAALEDLTQPDAKGRKPSGLSTWRKLRAVERDAHAAATAQCNGAPYRGQPFRTEEEYEGFTEEIRARVAKILQRPEPPPWLRVNGDPRGYALKIRTPRSDPHRTPDNVTECPGLESDWGGYGILARRYRMRTEEHTRNTALPTRAHQDPGPLHLNIMAVPCLSFLHATQEDKEQTERGDYQPGVLGVLDAGCGVLLHIGEDEPTAEDWPGYSAAFVALLQWVQSRGYHYLRLDYDAETLPGVPVFPHDDQ